MRASVVFISGPMTGHPDYNRPAFNHIADGLRKHHGYIVLNPAILPDGLEHHHYLKISLAMLEQADAIYLLNGWEHSKGAVEEFDRAKCRDLHFLFETTEAFNAAVARSRLQRGERKE
ncbi:DUF4406 domain-containing protein [Martelella alba]|uniref:DUF4406 domain-containing protein n=1 Tax=Martelella alba TaxID=2590451 RepID=A0ABY2SQZ4_9HYPH|nr:DUF4406 domain-containing protein [Martelella alba]TKI08639.1 DUF4406 domain-containing protein [Martelella alba]